MKDKKTIIWDWNGTLLNDTELCISIVNNLLNERGVEKLSTERYKEIFNFPVKDYYEEAGFDFSKEDFSKPADAFIEEYNNRIPDASLHQNTEVVLEEFKTRNYKQIIISAMKHDALMYSVKAKGIHHYFDEVSGINNHYAAGKLENAISILNKKDLNPDECCLIGDTIHDHEVAEAIGCDCILISNGHQSIERLEQTGRKVLKNIDQLLHLL